MCDFIAHVESIAAVASLQGRKCEAYPYSDVGFRQFGQALRVMPTS